MDHIKFRQINKPHQLEALMYHGVLLVEYNRSNIVMRLFALEDFYVEILSQRKGSEVLTITSYPDIEGLDHFLSRIDISALHLQ